MSDTDDVEFHLLVSSFDNNARALVYPGLSNGLTPANKRKIEHCPFGAALVIQSSEVNSFFNPKHQKLLGVYRTNIRQST
ncbi:uncharacterized protein DFL_000651 [Arthrobotrys flagrans]|uniref:Uncharacterized protein n=1 Tax=Arthrobotrys flagrans TaxID=97331 RepID=A0A437AED4_ARTFL|nr:hypothetical protein DFL_000651 [Arthrobotrys flagrans]